MASVVLHGSWVLIAWKERASGGKGGQATVPKNIVKAGCECSQPSFLGLITFSFVNVWAVAHGA
ncbi:hypothetical protein DSLASN_33720 [Desulfoluna limicola]|uniref:Uncharacterized protein n=1 Tax=Desulfoluna limicola TaxID=2810562 RepID=A0ABN6F7K4_9BACT|nr:hypothetical protein DSLASN_33720 [Desulfoluna limicola]